MREICRKIDAGLYAWFAVRVEAYKGGILLGSDYLGGCLYDTPMQFVKESGNYSDMVDNAVQEAKDALEKLHAIAWQCNLLHPLGAMGWLVTIQ